MKAAYIERTGPPELIQYGDLPMPEIGGSQVLVKVQAVAVNPIDTYIRSGTVAMNLTFPFIVGCDLAGVVERCGPQATRFKPGLRVWGSNQGLLGRQGTFAEYAAVDEQWLYPMPDKVDFEPAAAIALVGITAHLGLVQRARLQAGETLFVNGGSGGVGSTVRADGQGSRREGHYHGRQRRESGPLPQPGRRSGHQLQDRGCRRSHQGVFQWQRRRECLVGNAPRGELRAHRAAAWLAAAG